MKEKFKFSNYNIIYNLTNKTSIVYNTYSGAIIKIPKKIIDKGFFINKNITFNKNDLNNYPFLFLLMNNGIIIPEENNELNLIQQNYNDTLQNNRTLRLFISLTMDCNFDCKYCYQDRKDYYMNEHTASCIVNYIDTEYSNGKFDNIELNWIGGEPLLNKQIINYIVSRLSKYRKVGIIHTNGYLLNTYSSDFIRKHVKQIFITIDGPRFIHNKRRQLINGKGTYEKIISNIQDIVNYPDNRIIIIVNTNIDIENIEYYTTLIDDLKKFDLAGKIKLNITKTINGLGRGANYKPVLSYKDYSLKTEEFYKMIESNNFGKRNLPKKRNIVCNAEFSNTLYIGYNGDMFKCMSFSEDKYKIGSVLDITENLSLNKTLSNHWPKIKCFDDNICIECKYLPLCLGGCPADRIEKDRVCYYDRDHDLIKKRVLFSLNKDSSI